MNLLVAGTIGAGSVLAGLYFWGLARICGRISAGIGLLEEETERLEERLGRAVGPVQ